MKTRVEKYKVGDRVVLPANEEEGWVEQTGTVSAVEGKNMYLVDVTPEDVDDDGIREVHASGLVKDR
jgi:hypothetical protein